MNDESFSMKVNVDGSETMFCPAHKEYFWITSKNQKEPCRIAKKVPDEYTKRALKIAKGS